MSTNMQIWEKVSTTDTRYTKAAEVGGQKITSLNGTAMIMKATEVFGPVGIGFGWTVMEERFDEGSEMASGEGDKRLVLGHELNHTIKIRFWFELDGKRGEIEQYGCTRYLYKSKFGTTATRCHRRRSRLFGAGLKRLPCPTPQSMSALISERR